MEQAVAGAMITKKRKQYERSAPRFDFITLAWFKRVDAEASESEEGIARSCDISEAGVGAILTRRLPVGALVLLQLVTRDTKVCAVATVVHCAQLDDGRFRVGLQVGCVPPADRAA